jgi:hypothetical protein
MRTLITRTAWMLATALTFHAASANTPAFPVPDLTRSMERELDRQINRFVTYPVFDNANMNGEVTVTFVIDIQGKVEVIDARSTNVRLRSYVLNKLAKVDIGDNPNGTWKTTHMKFVFHPEL